MNVALITSRFAPETSSAAKRATDLASALRSAGHRVTVLTQIPNYPDPSAFDHEVTQGTKIQVENDADGFATWRVVPRLVAKRNLAGRLLAEARFAAAVSRRCTNITDLDGVVASTPFVFNLVAARSYRVPMWLDVRDLTWEYARDLGSSSRFKRLGANFLRSLAISSLKKARRVSTTTESQRQYLIERGVPSRQVEVVPNGVRLDVTDKLGRLGAAAASKGREGPVKLVYAGLLGFPQGLEFAVESVAEMVGDDVELHIFGDGVDRQKLEDRCRSHDLHHVHIHGHVTYEKYLKAIAGADILLASLRPEVRSAMPAKIWEYMAAGKPILLVGSGEAAKVISEAGAGTSVAHGKKARFQERLRELMRDATLRRQLGANGRTWVLQHRVREDVNRRWVERIEEEFSRPTPGPSRVVRRDVRDERWTRKALTGTARFVGWSAESTGILRVLERTSAVRENRLAILTYHRIADEHVEPRPCPGLVSASPETFATQMDYLAANCRVISMQDVLEALRNGGSLPARSVLLTFDDAYHDFADNAWPVLKRRELPVTLFVPTAFPDHPERSFWWDRLHRATTVAHADSYDTPLGEISLKTPSQRLRSFRRLRDGIKKLPHQQAMEVVDRICADLRANDPLATSGVLGWDALRALAKDGVTLGPHTRTHPLLDRISRDEIRAEVTGALADLERQIGETLPIFAYPAGHHSKEAVQVLAEAGIEVAFTTRGGVNDLRHPGDALRLRRIHVGRQTTRPILRAKLLGMRRP